MLIFNRRTRLLLAIVQQRAILGGAPTLRLQAQPTNYTLIPHSLIQYSKLLQQKEKNDKSIFDMFNF